MLHESANPSAGLREAVDAARSRTARLRLVDLHVHTMDSGRLDYKGPDSDAYGFLEHVRTGAPDLAVLGICDHFKCRIACEVATHAGPLPLLVLPGIEISVRLSEFSPDKVHMVVLFSPTASTEDIYSVVSALGGPPYQQADIATVLECTCAELLDVVSSRQAICIAAHANSSNGLRNWARKATLELVPLSRRRSDLKRLDHRTPEETAELAQIGQQLAAVEDQVQRAWLTFLGSTSIAAVELESGDDVPYYRGQHVRDLGIRPIACVLSSDAHSPDLVARPPKQTFLRLGGQSLSAVRAALADPETRVRFALPNPLDRPVIEGISFVRADAQSSSFFSDCTIGFSENLTCIIGPRGSGKSAVIEAIRYTLELPERGDQSLRTDAQRRRAATLAATEVRLLLTPRRQPSVVACRSLDEEPTHWDVSEHGAPIDSRIVRQFSAEIYGWSEIEQLGRDQTAQRELLDARSDEAIRLQRAVQEAKDKLRANRASIIEQVSRLSALVSQLAELPALRRQIELLETPALAAAFAERDTAETGKQLADSMAEGYAEAVAPLMPTAETSSAPLPVAIEQWNSKRRALADLDKSTVARSLLSEKLDGHVAHLVQKLSEAAGAAETPYNLLKQTQSVADGALTQADTAINQHLEHHFAEDLKSGRSTIDDLLAQAQERKTLKAELENLEQIEQEHQREHQELKRLLAQRENVLLSAFLAAQKQLSDHRRGRAFLITRRLSLLADRAPVTVSVERASDRTGYRDALYEPTSDTGHLKGTRIHAFREREIADRLASTYTPQELVRIIRRRLRNQIARVFAADTKGDPLGDADRLLNAMCPAPQRHGYDHPEKLDALLSIEEIALDDRPVIKLDGTPIEDLSPGQRCTALLPIILTQGDWPLVIDQPEDNLDNMMIFDVVVDVLRRLKDKRQIIVATHNPNIPVSGDAEQVVVLRAESRTHGYPVADGAIDFPHIIEHVTNIMEGGEQAFKIRAMKYGFDLRETIAHRSRSDHQP